VSETFQVNAPLEGPLTREQYFSLRAVAGMRPASRFAVGTAALGGGWGPVDERESVRLLLDGFERGHLLVDSSPAYAHGASEEVLGKALREWKGAAPLICTKLEGYDGYRPGQLAADWRACLQKQFDTSRKRFGGRRVDGLAMHDAEGAPPEFQHVCHDFLCELHERGEIGAMGLGGGGPTIQPRFLETGRYRYVITFKRLTAVSLQSTRDTVPACRENGAAVMVGSAVFMGLLAGKFGEWTVKPPEHVAGPFVERAKRLKKLADAAGLPLSHVALRFVWSMPMVDFVLVGAGTPSTWRDTLDAYESGPLPADLYRRAWEIAQQGPEPVCGG
jgi:aryl-alcohol dehydrogenase-like predicted oxidoreductase